MAAILKRFGLAIFGVALSFALVGGSPLGPPSAEAGQRAQHLKQKRVGKKPGFRQITSLYCEVYNRQRVQIVYNNPSASNYTCSSKCYYSINKGPVQTLQCTATAFARTSRGLFCASNSYQNVRVTNPGSNNCP